MDREKVTYGLRCMCYGDVECKECPYARDGSGWHDCRSNCAKDAIELLKEQDAVEPKKVKGYNPPMYTIYEYECEKCESPILNKQPFCMGCGRSVKWDE